MTIDLLPRTPLIPLATILEVPDQLLTGMVADQITEDTSHDRSDFVVIIALIVPL